MAENTNNGKLNELMEKWGAKSAMLLLALCAFIYQQDRASLQSDNKALSARVSASERAIGRLQEGKASREEVRAMMETIRNDSARGREDFKEIIQTLRSDLIQRMDIIAERKSK